jgi:hypothetical protein
LQALEQQKLGSVAQLHLLQVSADGCFLRVALIPFHSRPFNTRSPLSCIRLLKFLAATLTNVCCRSK